MLDETHEDPILVGKQKENSEKLVKVKLQGFLEDSLITNKTINVPNVMKAHKFNKDIDISFNIRTKSMLVSPIRNKSGVPFGVILAVNKKREPHFNTDDEYILESLAMSAGIEFVNVQKQD